MRKSCPKSNSARRRAGCVLGGGVPQPSLSIMIGLSLFMKQSKLFLVVLLGLFGGKCARRDNIRSLLRTLALFR